jgi:DNA-binding transcriptional LysR family regulator
MIGDLDVTRLRIFREVAARGSFTAAAAALNISQPAVSQQIMKLEQEVGVSLLDRSNRGLRPTHPGQVLLAGADRILAELAQTGRDLAAAIAPNAGELRMAAFPSAAATIVPPVIAAFRLAMPDVRVRLSEADPPVSLPQLRAGDHDIALAYGYPCLASTDDPLLHTEILVEDAMAVAVPAGHPLASADQIPLETLRTERWIAPHHCVCRDALTLSCRIAGFTPSVVSETNDYMAMLGLVAAGVGVAVVPRLVAAIAIHPAARLRPLTGTALHRTITAVTRVSGYRPTAVATMQDLLRTTLDGLAHPDFPFTTRRPAGVPG